MPELGNKHNCYSCHTKFYDFGKPEPICPKCGADQRKADESSGAAPARPRRARTVKAPIVEPEEEVEDDEEDAKPSDDDEVADDDEESVEDDEEDDFVAGADTADEEDEY